eukprot:350867-Pyramimonas_sp.AAC.1
MAMPAEVDGGVKVLALGSLSQAPSFSDKFHLWPEGYCTEWQDPATDTIYICDIRKGCGPCRIEIDSRDLFAREFNSPTDSVRTAYVRVEPYRKLSSPAPKRFVSLQTMQGRRAR